MVGEKQEAAEIESTTVATVQVPTLQGWPFVATQPQTALIMLIAPTFEVGPGSAHLPAVYNKKPSEEAYETVLTVLSSTIQFYRCCVKYMRLMVPD